MPSTMKINTAIYHILIVEDEPLLSINYYDALKELNYNVSQAASLQTARNILSSSFINLIILDGDLPDGKGIELIPFINLDSSSAINHDIPIIFLSAYGGISKMDIKNNSFNNIVENLQKPVAINMLVNYVNNAITNIPVQQKDQDRYTRFINNSERKNLLNSALYYEGSKSNGKK